MLSLRDWRAFVLWPGVCFLGVFLVVELAQLDVPIANALFFSPARGWLGAGAGDFWAHRLIHDAGRWIVRGVAICALVLWAASFAARPLAAWRRAALYVFVAIVASTALVGILKIATNVDCPWDLAGFGGDRPYVALFSDRPDYLPRAQCFPGAHSSSGFALMSLFFALRGRRPGAARWLLAAGIVTGTVFSLGQQARGAHFFSHDFTSAALVWWVLVALYVHMLAPRPRRSEEDARQ